MHKRVFKLGPIWNVTLNPNLCISFLIFGRTFGTQRKVIVCFLLVLLLLLFLLLLLLVLRVFFSKLLIFFFNVFQSCPFSQHISVRCFLSAFKYFLEQILVALARNPLNMLVIVSGGIQEWGLICTFVRADLRWTSNSYLPLLFFIFISRKFKHFSSFSSSMVNWMRFSCLFKMFWNSKDYSIIGSSILLWLWNIIFIWKYLSKGETYAFILTYHTKAVSLC